MLQLLDLAILGYSSRFTHVFVRGVVFKKKAIWLCSVWPGVSGMTNLLSLLYTLHECTTESFGTTWGHDVSYAWNLNDPRDLMQTETFCSWSHDRHRI